MKSKVFLGAIFVMLMTTGADCINDPLIVALNVDPISGCFRVNTGNGSFNDQTSPIIIKGLIPSDFADNLREIRLYDIRIRVVGPYPTGNVTGACYFSFDNQPQQLLMTFSGAYSSYANGVSLLNPAGLAAYNLPGLQAFIAALSNVNSLPTQIVLRGQGSGPAVTQNFSICVDILVQADAVAN